MIRLLTGLICFGAIHLLEAQENTVESFFQFSKGFDLPDRWSADIRSELRFTQWESEKSVSPVWSQLYVQSGFAYALRGNWKLGATYRLSRRGALTEAPGIENRFAQQLSNSRRFSKFRLRQRLLLEQRVFSHSTRHRWRLRAALDYPLNGERLDTGEWYLNHQIAFLTEPFESTTWAGREHRFYSGAGILIPGGSRFEAGIEARLSRVPLKAQYEQRWILRTNWSW